MKECPICHARYDDSVDFCVNDGGRLVSVAENPVEKPTPPPAPQPKPSPAPAPQPVPRPTPPLVNNRGEARKKSSHTLLKAMAVLAILAGGAYYYYNNAASYLNVEPSEVELGKCGEGKEDVVIGIDYDGYAWKINHVPSWLSYYDKYRRRFSLRAEGNDTGSPREGTITIQSGKHLVYVKVRQRGEATYIKPETTEVHFPLSGGEQKINVETDGIFTPGTVRVECPFDNIKVSVSEYEHSSTQSDFTIKADRFDGFAQGGYITLREDNASCTISISQNDYEDEN